MARKHLEHHVIRVAQQRSGRSRLL